MAIQEVGLFVIPRCCNSQDEAQLLDNLEFVMLRCYVTGDMLEGVCFCECRWHTSTPLMISSLVLSIL